MLTTHLLRDGAAEVLLLRAAPCGHLHHRHPVPRVQLSAPAALHRVRLCQRPYHDVHHPGRGGAGVLTEHRSQQSPASRAAQEPTEADAALAGLVRHPQDAADPPLAGGQHLGSRSVDRIPQASR